MNTGRYIVRIILWSLFVTLISLVFKLDYMLSIMLFFGVPMVWFSMWKTNYIRRTLIFSICLTLPLMGIGEYLAVAGHAWYVNTSVLPWRFLGYLTVEDLLLCFLSVYVIVMWYESTFRTDHPITSHQRLRRLVTISVLLIIGLIVLITIGFNVFTIPDIYAWLAITTLIPPIVISLLRAPYLFRRFVATAIVFGGVLFLFEITGNVLDQWMFPGTYIGMVNLFDVQFPLEELIFWVVLFPVGVLSYYELYDNEIRVST